ncbi:hypothetical protein ACQ86N_33875 [Puia sp. P3]|uniref:hypothetical protein n=1 Tax=Puia sp. P3 TaxID=3423952 RepID=UPI003D6651EF
MHGSGIIRILLIILVAGILMDWYVFSGLKTLTKGWKSRRLAAAVKWGYLFVSIGVTLLFLLGLGSFRTASGMRPYHEWVLSLVLALTVTRVFFVVVLLLGDIGPVLLLGCWPGVGEKGRWQQEAVHQPGRDVVCRDSLYVPYVCHAERQI